MKCRRCAGWLLEMCCPWTRNRAGCCSLTASRIPRNFGALVRAADGAGVECHPRAPPRRGSALSRRRGSVSRGDRPRPPGSDSRRCGGPAGPEGARVLGRRTHSPGNPSLDEFDWTQPTVLTVGSEGRGLAAGVSKECEVLVSLPQLGSVRSLNVSVATGIVLYETVRQRGSGRPGEAGLRAGSGCSECQLTPR